MNTTASANVMGCNSNDMQPVYHTDTVTTKLKPRSNRDRGDGKRGSRDRAAGTAKGHFSQNSNLVYAAYRLPKPSPRYRAAPPPRPWPPAPVASRSTATAAAAVAAADPLHELRL